MENSETEQTIKEMFEKIYILLRYPTVSSEEFVAVDDYVNIAPIVANRHFGDW